MLKLVFDIVVDAAAANACFTGPGIDVRTGLARAHVPHAGLVPQVAYFGVVTSLRPVLQEANEHLLPVA